MKKLVKRVPTLFLLGGLVCLLALAGGALALNPNEEEINDPNRGSVALDECGDCTWDYTGLRWLGSGGQGGRGTIHWPGGQTGNNYGQMCFTTDCEMSPNPSYAWCVDLYHPAQSAPYGVDIYPGVISGDSCHATQLQALAYLFAWHTPASIFEDDAYQVAIWKLTSFLDGGPNQGLPHFCYDAGRGYPNFADTPVYPYVNTVYCTNAPRNDQANSWALEAIGKNVVLPGDVWGDACYGPAIEGDYATVDIRLCLTRGDYAWSLNNTDLENIKVELAIQIGDGPVENGVFYTDEDGCIHLSVTQLIAERAPVTVSLCSRTAWPYAVIGCNESDRLNKQWLVIEGETDTLCQRWVFPGDKWLSVELAGFDAYTTADGVDLQWTTASESNADHWEIERCVNGTSTFEKLAELEAQNSASGATYRYADRYGVAGTTYDYRLIDVDASGVRTAHSTVSARFGETPAAVLEYNLADAYPNPFNPSTTISFTVPEVSEVTLRIFDVSGREVASLLNGPVNAGEHVVEWNAEGLPSGTYFYSLTAPNYTATKKLLLLK